MRGGHGLRARGGVVRRWARDQQRRDLARGGHVDGPLEDINQLKVEATVDRLEMAVFDYGIRIPSPIRLSMDRQVVRVENFQLVGDQTQLSIGGSVSLGEQRVEILRFHRPKIIGIPQHFELFGHGLMPGSAYPHPWCKQS